MDLQHDPKRRNRVPLVSRMGTRANAARSLTGATLVLPPERQRVRPVAKARSEIDAQRAFLCRALDPDADARVDLKRIARSGG